MIRLAVSGADEELLAQATPRLTGGTASVWWPDPAAEDFKSCDAVVFRGPSETHAPRIEQALQAGKHVLLCGECTLTPQKLASLSAAARAVKKQFSVVNPDRFLPSRLLIHQELASGKLGEPGLVRIHRWESQAGDGPQSIIPAPLLRDLDMMCWLLGKPPNLIFAAETVAESTTNSGRCIQVHLGYSGSAMGMLTYANGLPAGESYELLHVIGSAGAAYVDDQANRQLLYSRGGSASAVQAPERVRQTALLLQDFVDGLVDGRDLSPTVTNWQNVLATAEAMHRSLESRRAIPLEGR